MSVQDNKRSEQEIEKSRKKTSVTAARERAGRIRDVEWVGSRAETASTSIGPGKKNEGSNANCGRRHESADAPDRYNPAPDMPDNDDLSNTKKHREEKDHNWDKARKRSSVLRKFDPRPAEEDL